MLVTLIGEAFAHSCWSIRNEWLLLVGDSLTSRPVAAAAGPLFSLGHSRAPRWCSLQPTSHSIFSTQTRRRYVQRDGGRHQCGLDICVCLPKWFCYQITTLQREGPWFKDGHNRQKKGGIWLNIHCDCEWRVNVHAVVDYSLFNLDSVTLWKPEITRWN